MSYNIWHKHMKDNLILQDKNYISAKRASELVGYTRDYVGQLSREGKIDSRMVGRSRFISEESILNHKSLNALNNKKNAELLLINKRSGQTTQIVETSSNTVSEKNTENSNTVNVDKLNSTNNTTKTNPIKRIPSNVLPAISNPILPVVKSAPSPLIDKNIFSGISGTVSNNIVNPVKSAINNSQIISGMPQLSVAGSSVKFGQSINPKSGLVANTSKLYTKENIAIQIKMLLVFQKH